ncbi:MAG TPA: OmpA family protein [Pseudonocardiaceae bacterium]|nr:OmpA family protein [Pseudonocardiaceae bacterium]
MLEDSGSAVGSCAATAARTSGIETTAPAIPPTRRWSSTLPRRRAGWTLAGAAAALAAVTCAIGIGLSGLEEVTAASCHCQAGPAAAPAPAAPAPAPVKANLPASPYSVSFVANSTTLTLDEKTRIRNLAAAMYVFLIAHPDGMVIITGYAANAPGSTVAGRQEMSLARARTVASLLVAAGIPAERTIVIAGHTDSSAILNGVFEEDLAAQMRRVDITLQP